MSEEKTAKTDKGPSAATAPVVRGPPEPEAGRVDGIEQVRELLFGAMYRELEVHMSRTETQVAARIHDLEQESRRRTEVIETHLKKEIETLASRFDRQLAQLNETLRNLERDQRDLASQIERRIVKAEETSSAAQQELRQRLLDQAKSFLDELQVLRKDMLATFHRELGIEGGDLLGAHSEAEGGVRH
jgi:hypothetical protein